MVTVTGVRWAESPRRRANHGLVDFQTKPKGTRKKADQIGAEYALNKHGSVLLMDDNDPSRRLVEQCFRTRKTLFNPIIDWTDEDVWGFIRQQNLSYCSLYDEGFKRLGCIGCPLSGRKNMERDFERWPRYKELYIRAFQKMIENHPGEIRVLKPAEEENHKGPCENGGGGTSWNGGCGCMADGCSRRRTRGGDPGMVAVANASRWQATVCFDPERGERKDRNRAEQGAPARRGPIHYAEVAPGEEGRYALMHWLWLTDIKDFPDAIAITHDKLIDNRLKVNNYTIELTLPQLK